MIEIVSEIGNTINSCVTLCVAFVKSQLLIKLYSKLLACDFRVMRYSSRQLRGGGVFHHHVWSLIQYYGDNILFSA